MPTIAVAPISQVESLYVLLAARVLALNHRLLNLSWLLSLNTSWSCGPSGFGQRAVSGTTSIRSEMEDCTFRQASSSCLRNSCRISASRREERRTGVGIGLFAASSTG